MRTRLSFRATLVLVAGLIVCDVSRAADPDFVLLNPMKLIERNALRAFLERPLFDPERRLAPVAALPPAVEAPPPSLPPEPPPTMHLLGVIHGRRDMAVVHRDGEEKTFILHTGDHVGNWGVTVLPPVSVRVQSGERAFDYVLFGKFGDVGPIAVDPVTAPKNATKSFHVGRRAERASGGGDASTEIDGE